VFVGVRSFRFIIRVRDTGLGSMHGSRPGETREAESEREPRLRLAVVGAPR
jgi:hypothetical protein